MNILLNITKILSPALKGVSYIFNTCEPITKPSQKFDEIGLIFTVRWKYFIQPSVSILYLVVII